MPPSAALLPEFLAKLNSNHWGLIQSLQFAAVLPQGTCVWPWIADLMSFHLAEFGIGESKWQSVRKELEEYRLLTSVADTQNAQLATGVGECVLGLLNDTDREIMMTDLRVVVSRRINNFADAKRGRVREAMKRANSGKEVTAWTVPSYEAAAASAAGHQDVSVTPNSDGSYSVAVQLPDDWEQSCIDRFCAWALGGDSLDMIETVLRSSSRGGKAFEPNRERIEALCISAQPSLQVRIVQGLVLLAQADGHAANGYWRSAWAVATPCFKLFEELHKQHPRSTDVAELYYEAYRASYLYDD